jgi:hypothetical protein
MLEPLVGREADQRRDVIPVERIPALEVFVISGSERDDTVVVALDERQILEHRAGGQTGTV